MMDGKCRGGWLSLSVALGCSTPSVPNGETVPNDSSAQASEAGTGGGDSDGSALPGTTSGIEPPEPEVDPDSGDDLRFDLAASSFDLRLDEPVECTGLRATIRDFMDSHPDFEDYLGGQAYLGLVMPTLGPDRKPVYNPDYVGSKMISSPQTFAQWYNDGPGVSIPLEIQLPLVEDEQGNFAFDDPEFFPIDELGWGNQGRSHNYHFTTEIHTGFTYRGGEVFTFRGDDDLWLFVNDVLVIDLGGLHSALERSISMDLLGLTVGETYPMDIFHAERHTFDSNFRIVTNIACFTDPAPRG